ncbi:hypothetical protein C2G38_2221958 [Gigaspora rosea]|uniref:Uncharacterized protein n=1 Tax=Gigaspora rosea TaxID=44941 RepID=A0A397U4M9_9GLOM|nr:hypothetical protein C2G38_2221958 [Gigaspora rosea]
MVQYQPLENIFSTIYWKHFDSLDKSNNNFSVGDIVSIAGKFGIENLEQFITIASATIVDKKDSTDEFNSEIIPFNTLYLIFNATVTRDLKTSGETIHFRVETCKYNSCTRNCDIHIPITIYYPIQCSRFNHLRTNLKIGKLLMISGFLYIIKSTVTIIEAMDVDYLKQEISYNTSKNLFQTNTHPFIDLNRIADEISAMTLSIHNNKTKQNDDDNEQKQNIKTEYDPGKEKVKEIKKETEKENRINIKIIITMILNKRLT